VWRPLFSGEYLHCSSSSRCPASLDAPTHPRCPHETEGTNLLANSRVGLDNLPEGAYIQRPLYWMMGIAVNQQVTMMATYLRSQSMTGRGQACNCSVGGRVSGAGLTWKGANPEICGAHVFDACAQSFCTAGVCKHPAGNREVYMI
jgi:hypothetical protein